ncbi:MAG: hypothetical protein WBC78_20670 [Candidatus Sulfotelmatobacter sp.]
MRIAACFFILILILTTIARAQNPAQSASPADAKFVTVPVTLDRDRIVIDVDVPLTDGSTRRVRAWVDNGDPEQWMSSRVSAWLGLGVGSCNGQVCSAKSPTPMVSLEILIGGMKVFLSAMGEITVPVGDQAPIAPGMNAEVNIPSTVLRNYDVLINFPGHEFTIGQPGSLKFQGVKAKVMVNGENGLIQVPSQIENKKYNLGLDVGSSISFLTDDLFDKLTSAHPDWPHMIGAIGPANIWGMQDEPKWKLMRVARVQYGPLFLTDVAAVEFPSDRMEFFEKRAGVATAGLLGANALVNYRVGLDYAHSTVYFEIGRTFNFPAFDVIGLVLHPEIDGRFTILGVADYAGRPSVPEVQAGDQLIAVDGIPTVGSTLGQVWTMLGGEARKERRLTIERAGKQVTIIARVQHFLGEDSDNPNQQSFKKKN